MPEAACPPHTIDELYALFDRTAPPSRALPDAEVPQPYRRLLAHDDHMTVTLERYHGGPVRLEVLDWKFEDPYYCRRILLHKNSRNGSQPVQFGIVRFDFRPVSEKVRNEILERRTPLGRVLIENETLRHIDFHSVVEIEPDPELAQLLDVPAGQKVWGRLATINCEGKPTVALLEVLARVGETTSD